MTADVTAVTAAAVAYGNDRADEQAAADQAVLASAEATIADLRQKLADCQKPPPPPVATAFGISVNDTADVPRIEALTAPDAVQAVRIFSSGAIGTWGPLHKAAFDNGVRTFHHSWKIPLTQAAMDAFAKTVPGGIRLLLTEHHEPENDGSAFSGTAWQTAQKKASDLVHQHAGFEFWMTLMAYTLTPGSGRDVKNWLCPKGTHDGISWDCYNRDLTAYIPKFQAIAVQQGVPWGLSETGASTVVHPDGGGGGTPQSQAQRVAWAAATRKALLTSALPKATISLWWDVGAGSSFDNTLNEGIADAYFGTAG